MKKLITAFFIPLLVCLCFTIETYFETNNYRWFLTGLANISFCFLGIILFNIFGYYSKQQDPEEPGESEKIIVVLFVGLITFSVMDYKYSLPKFIEYRVHEYSLNTEKGQKKTRQKEISEAIIIISMNDHPGKDPTSQLNNRIKKMSLLKEKLVSKTENITKLASDFGLEISVLKNDIKDSGLSYSEAIKNSTYNQKMALLQRKMARKELLNLSGKMLTTGTEDLSIKIDEAYTELQMINVLGKDESKKLFTDIDEVLNEYRQYTTDSKIDKSRLRLLSLPEIWQSISE